MASADGASRREATPDVNLIVSSPSFLRPTGSWQDRPSPRRRGRRLPRPPRNWSDTRPLPRRHSSQRSPASRRRRPSLQRNARSSASRYPSPLRCLSPGLTYLAFGTWQCRSQGPARRDGQGGRARQHDDGALDRPRQRVLGHRHCVRRPTFPGLTSMRSAFSPLTLRTCRCQPGHEPRLGRPRPRQALPPTNAGRGRRLLRKA